MIANDQVGVQFQDILKLFTNRFEHMCTHARPLTRTSHTFAPFLSLQPSTTIPPLSIPFLLSLLSSSLISSSTC
jgi:hypothetical protein